MVKARLVTPSAVAPERSIRVDEDPVRPHGTARSLTIIRQDEIVLGGGPREMQRAMPIAPLVETPRVEDSSRSRLLASARAAMYRELRDPCD